VATQLQSNTLLLVNISDGTPGQTPEVPDYYVHIRYSDSSDGSSGLSETPLAYIGLYVGIEVDPPKDPSKYTWSKYGGESSFVDIRYSNDGGKTLTLDDNNVPTGKDAGSWMGVLVTTDTSVLDDTWYPEKTLEDGTLISPILLTDYTWTEIEQTFSNESIFLESEYSNIHKFFTTDGTYTYSPNSITFYLK